MEANEFVKKFGLDTFRLSVGFVSTRKYLVVYEDEIDFADEIKPSHGECVFDRSEVKRLVESHELVAIHGFEKSKEIVANAPSDDHFYSWTLGGSGVRDKTVNIGELRKAIADVESCMELANDSC